MRHIILILSTVLIMHGCSTLPDARDELAELQLRVSSLSTALFAALAEGAKSRAHLDSPGSLWPRLRGRIVGSHAATASAPLTLHLDEPREGELIGTNLRVAGWAWSPDAEVRVDVLCDGVLLGTAATGLPRGPNRRAADGWNVAIRR